MRDDFLNVLPVRAYQFSQGYLPIPNLDLKTLTKKAFHKLYERALSQIIGASLKAKAQNAHFADFRPQHGLGSPFNMLRIAGQDAFK